MAGDAFWVVYGGQAIQFSVMVILFVCSGIYTAMRTVLGDNLGNHWETVITGEEKLLLVVQESEANGVDTLIRERFPEGLSVDSSTPLIPSGSFAERMQIPIPEGSPVPLDNGRLIWFEVNIGYPGKTLEDLMTAWREEAVYALNARRKFGVKLYKVVGERKVHVFMRVPPEQADAMTFELPLIKHLGDSIQIRTKGAIRY